MDAHPHDDAPAAAPTAGAGGPASPSEEFLELLHDVLRSVRREASTVLGHDITPGQLRLLRTLDRCDRPRRLGELADVLDVAPRSITSKVDQAEEDGWVRRVPDPADRRATLVELTDAGREQLARLSDRRQEGARARLDVLAPQEQAQLLALLRRVAHRP
ncbi:MarR family transcriptional regulator [Cellulomonas sp.]|uniref:MarR family winged helix-turn-helix transcriptional regulator n=1 Tax=Cellulomonas sp. TaxID=40001 RepID=UPI0028114E2A|nr:MarR family transcriptional regulator [Cellulomonas sp.]